MASQYPEWAKTDAQQDLYVDARGYGLESNDVILKKESSCRRYVDNKRQLLNPTQQSINNEINPVESLASQLIKQMKNLGKELSADKANEYVNSAYTQCLIFVSLIKPSNSDFDKLEAVRNKHISVKTAKTLIDDHQLVMDGLLPYTSGQDGTAFIKFINYSTNKLFIGKLYGEEGKVECQHEYEMVKSLHSNNPNQHLVDYEKIFTFKHVSLLRGGDLHVILMRSYDYSLYEYLSAFHGDTSKLTSSFVASIFNALCEVGACFEKNKICHGDIKPGNIMIADSAGIIHLIDCAGAVSYGSKLAQHTAFFHLDVPLSNVNAVFDTTCVLTTLTQMLEPEIKLSKRVELRNFLLKITDPSIRDGAIKLFDNKSFL